MLAVGNLAQIALAGNNLQRSLGRVAVTNAECGREACALWSMTAKDCGLKVR